MSTLEKVTRLEAAVKGGESGRTLTAEGVFTVPIETFAVSHNHAEIKETINLAVAQKIEDFKRETPEVKEKFKWDKKDRTWAQFGADAWHGTVNWLEPKLSTWKKVPWPIRWIVSLPLLVPGAIMMVTPGPGIPFLLLGIVIATADIRYLRWAEKAIVKASSTVKSAYNWVTNKKDKDSKIPV